ncbi:MAG TPA: hypothetical protein PL143_01510 [Rhodocyclaceae bacterium]|nr:hypothetical protein [Rhodocyclaceae bacterium]
MKVPQFDYCSPQAMKLRQQDNTPPWGVHVCEVDSLAGFDVDGSAFGQSLAEARRLRAELEAADDGQP